MEASQASNSRSASNGHLFAGRVPICGCDKTMRMFISNTGKNPNRRYWKCSKFNTNQQSRDLFRWDDELIESDFFPRSSRVMPQISDPIVEKVLLTPPTQISRCSGCIYADKLMEAGNKKIEKLQVKLRKERDRVHLLVVGLIFTLVLFIVHAIVVHLI